MVFTALCAREVRQVDICIYGATSSGVIAAYTACQQGKSVCLVEPSQRIGGLSAGGLGKTDVGRMEVIRGYAQDFYRRIGKYYNADKPMVTFEPKAALAVFQQFLEESGLTPLMPYRIVKASKKGNMLQSITVENSIKRGRDTKVTIVAKVFIDCSYEGDLMARAGISYAVGRESNVQYNETYNGAYLQPVNHQMPDGVDPYRIPGKASSGLLYGILKGKVAKNGTGDKHVQAYNFRITLTNEPKNMRPIEKPDGYDPSRYELLIRQKEKQPWKKGLHDIFIWDFMPNHKTDINNRNGMSTDMIGANWDYPEGSYKKREKIYKAHVEYTKGLLYFVGHDSRIPHEVRNALAKWGYPLDEYTDNDNFTPALYVREARRMIGRYVMTEHNCQKRIVAPDSIGWAAYNMDSHNSGRYVVDGMVKNEGNVEIRCPGHYPVSYRSITPQEKDACNVLVPVCLSASHIAYGSIRMEPVFMVLGETSALAACQAIDKHGCVVQNVDVKAVMRLFEDLEQKP